MLRGVPLRRLLYTARFVPVATDPWGSVREAVLAWVLEDLADCWVVERVADKPRYEVVEERLSKQEWRRE